MKHNNLWILFTGVFLIFSLVNQVQAWPDSAIYVQETSNAPVIDGIFDKSEWSTEEDTFSETLNDVVFGTITVDVSFSIVILRDKDNAYFLIQYKLSSETEYTGNASVGLALSAATIKGMNSAFDRKIINNIVYSNGTADSTEAYDLFYCSDDCRTNSRDERPGKLDDVNDIVASGYGEDGSTKFFEFSISLEGDGEQDVTFEEGTNFKLVINPFTNLYNVSANVGHGNLATSGVVVTFSPKSFFPRPEGPMDGLAIAFTSLFSLIIIGMSLALILTGRSDNLAEKFLRIDITEEMRDKSIIMEIGYYNSSFVSLFSLFYFWIFAIASVLYGWWANWGFTGLLINLPALLLSSYAGYDLIKRNHNPQSIPAEERRNLGRDIEKTNGLWIFPPVFLSLVLLMLVFVGIDVIS